MPLPDPSTQQQTELLREMRDEMRSIRAQGGGMGTSRADGLYRPPNTFVRGQLTTDRIMSGEFGNFGWTQAYNHLYRPSLMGDVTAAMGFARAPASMMQSEFQEMAQQRLGAFPGDLLTGIFAPGYRRRTNNLAQNILANSPRFMRFGDSSSVFGAGFRYQGARALARDIQLEAIGDVRLSSEDYSTIASTGMRGGQFDSVRGAGQFMQRMRELADATGNLTRTMHMSAGDVAQAMAQMRAVGITNIAQQEQVAVQSLAAAQVAGIAPGQMLSATMTAAQRGIQQGFAAPQTMDLAAGNITAMRGLRRAGLMDPHLIAAGGGAISIAQQITQQQQQFLGSDAGLMAFIGQRAGADGGFIQQMMGGLQGVAGRGFGGMLETRMDRMNILANMTAQEQQDLFRSSIEQQVQLLGVDDITSRRGQAAAFNVLVGQGMGDPAALAFVQSNFSPEGRRAQDAAELLRMRAEDQQERKLMDDAYFRHNSFAGRFNTARANALQTLGRWGRGIARTVETGQTGTFGLGSQIDYDLERLQRGTMPLNASRGDQAIALMQESGARRAADADEMRFSRIQGAGTAGVLIQGTGMLAGAAQGALWGAGIGSMIPIPGMTLVGGAIGAIAGAWGGYKLGTAASPTYTTESTLRGRYSVKLGQDVIEGLKSKTPSGRARELLGSEVLNKSTTVRRLLEGSADRKLGPAEMVEFTRDIDIATRELRFLGEDVSRADVVQMLKLSGVEVDAPEISGVLGLSQTSALKEYGEKLKEILPGSANEIEGTMVDAKTSGILHDYLGAVESGDIAAMGRARGRLMHDRGLTGEQIMELTEAFRGQDAQWRERFVNVAGQARGEVARGAVDRNLGLLTRLARSTVAGEGNEAARQRLQDIMAGRGGRGVVQDILAGESDLAQTLLGNRYIRDMREDVLSVDYANVSARDLAQKFGFSDSQAQQLLQLRDDAGEGGAQKLRDAIAAVAFSDVSLEGQGARESIERDTVAASLNNAANILERLVNELGINKAKKEAS